MGTLCLCYTVFFDFLNVPHGSTRIASISGVDVRQIPGAHNEIDVMMLPLRVDCFSRSVDHLLATSDIESLADFPIQDLFLINDFGRIYLETPTQGRENIIFTLYFLLKRRSNCKILKEMLFTLAV